MNKTKLIIISILLFGAFFRLYGINWDDGHHLHPDERAIVMTVDKLQLPQDISEFFNPDNSWNPKFFAYGSLPMYLLRVTGSILSPIDPSFGTYTSINLAGRFLSTIVDLLTMFLIYKIGGLLFNKKIGLLSAAFYSLSVLPIQLSHFFAVDTFLTMLITFTLYRMLLFYKKPQIKNATFVGIAFGLALASKISAIILLAPISLTLILSLFSIKFNAKDQRFMFSKFLNYNLIYGSLIIISALITYIFFMPYALIDFQNFWNQTLTQSQLTKNPFAFPYTLQYVDKIPYLYEFKNIFFWGLGPLLGALSFTGVAYFIYGFFQKANSKNLHEKLILLTFFISYTLVVGRFAVGFIRYMLPIYPLLALFGAYYAYKIINPIKSKPLLLASSLLLFAASLVWPLSFIQIYSRPNTRIMASNWIYQNIPPNKTIAVEHWDDQLPIGGPLVYPTQILKLYEPDTAYKWQEIETQLEISDYIVIASNRLYTPLQKLTNCKNLPNYKCYPLTAEYYNLLFSGQSEFQKVAEFTSHPSVPIVNILINDQSADESFTVYDHPKIIIFKKF